MVAVSLSHRQSWAAASKRRLHPAKLLASLLGLRLLGILHPLGLSPFCAVRGRQTKVLLRPCTHHRRCSIPRAAVACPCDRECYQFLHLQRPRQNLCISRGASRPSPTTSCYPKSYDKSKVVDRLTVWRRVGRVLASAVSTSNCSHLAYPLS